MYDDEFLKYAASLQFHLLYPMSGILSGISADTEEPPLTDGRIHVYLGQRQTAQMLRNICLKVVEQDEANKSKDWERIAEFINRIFLVRLKKPVFNPVRGNLVMSYRQTKVDGNLDISLTGRGLQQILLILAYLYWHKKSILLVDEPDAHLEILRQKQNYEILKHVARKNECQVIIATHSEVILDDAIETNLTLLLDGEAVNLAQRQDIKIHYAHLALNTTIKPACIPGDRLKSTLMKSVKMSEFDEKVFKAFAVMQNQPAILNKGDFYRLANYYPREALQGEVYQKLDLLVKYLNLKSP